ncbi:hypothetical protein AO265_00215 [Pseudomonas sp. ABAC61]|nr:hypothetical protein AO265_00215 [Pseudomonas sp. ABAC61]
MIRGRQRFPPSQPLVAQALHMIQGAATRALDLEFRKFAHPGEQSLAMTASAFFEHLSIPLISTALACQARDERHRST